ncbi:uncharacterized protein LOC114304910 [Camellia sinensis]|uniref:uncharacterized protein LOC114304910 n=1 Tax=Camellia sinensis TaxID=4442 RepID=UPI001035C2D0|nr:uncharacterized protein LOC114304910 [Camellia sinensis]
METPLRRNLISFERESAVNTGLALVCEKDQGSVQFSRFESRTLADGSRLPPADATLFSRFLQPSQRERELERERESVQDQGDKLRGFRIICLLRRFLEIQERRAHAYAKLKKGFADYMVSGGESVYQQLCSEITVEFNECSKQVLEMESLFLSPDCFRDDLAHLVRSIQVQEKQKLQLTATIQVLKKAGRPSERLVSHENCGFKRPMQHECVHVHKITEAAGTEEAEADAEYDNALCWMWNSSLQGRSSLRKGREGFRQ